MSGSGRSVAPALLGIVLVAIFTPWGTPAEVTGAVIILAIVLTAVAWEVGRSWRHS